jgi:hypothetical protein
MALSHSPQIVRDGLVLYLDPANTKSYPGSGTTFFDLSKNINATLVNGVLISNNRITLDGVNDYINTNTDSFDVSASIAFEFVVRLSTITQNKVLIGKYDGSAPDMWIGFRNDLQYFTAGYYGLQTPFVVTDNVFRHYVITRDTANTINKLYVNGNLITTNWIVRTNPRGNLMIGKFGVSADFYFPGDLGFIKIYNRNLSEPEIKQNFNATRGRYGI